jgi:hypothetical protein
MDMILVKIFATALAFDLRADPYERADITSNTYYDWLLAQGYVVVAAQSVVGNFLATCSAVAQGSSASSRQVGRY